MHLRNLKKSLNNYLKLVIKNSFIRIIIYKKLFIKILFIKIVLIKNSFFLKFLKIKIMR